MEASRSAQRHGRRFTLVRSDRCQLDSQPPPHIQWIHCFEGVQCLIFIVAISEYDQMLYEDENTNRIEEASTLWDSVANSRWFAQSSLVLFLNKTGGLRGPSYILPDARVCDELLNLSTPHVPLHDQTSSRLNCARVRCTTTCPSTWATTTGLRPRSSCSSTSRASSRTQTRGPTPTSPAQPTRNRSASSSRPSRTTSSSRTSRLR